MTHESSELIKFRETRSRQSHWARLQMHPLSPRQPGVIHSALGCRIGVSVPASCYPAVNLSTWELGAVNQFIFLLTYQYLANFLNHSLLAWINQVHRKTPSLSPISRFFHIWGHDMKYINIFKLYCVINLILEYTIKIFLLSFISVNLLLCTD